MSGTRLIPSVFNRVFISIIFFIKISRKETTTASNEPAIVDEGHVPEGKKEGVRDG